MDTESHEFDAFISYSHTDSAWVKGVLIPRLKGFGIRYAVDYEDFDPVQPFNSDMSRLTSISRCTLVVLTKHWMASRYTDFESQLAQVIKRPLVALRTDEYEVPGILRDAEILDMTSGDEEQTWARLRHALLPPQRPPRDFGAGIEIWRAYSGRTGYEYAADVVVNNAPGPALVFDSIELAAFAPRSAERQDAVASATRVLFIEGGGVSIVTSFDKKMADPFDTEHLEPVRLESGKGVTLKRLRLGPLRGSIPGKEPVGLSVCLWLGHKRVTTRSWCVVPPITRMPREDRDEGFRINFLRDEFLSPPSGILDDDLVSQIIKTAGEFSRDSLLERVAPELMTTHHMRGGGILHTVRNWRYRFASSRIRKCTFSISPQDPSWIDDMTPFSTQPHSWLSEELLLSSRLDGNLAYILARDSSCEGIAEGGNALFLETIVIDGVWRPLWHVPFKLKGCDQTAVSADTGELFWCIKDEWAKVGGALWNS